MKRFLKKASFSLFKAFSRLGIFVLPAHYYVPVADVNKLEKTKSTWAKRSEMPGVRINVKEQFRELNKICLPFKEEYRENKSYFEAMEGEYGVGFGYVESQALHGFLRYYKPNRVVEVGGGVSTYCILKALELNEKEGTDKAKITTIEPYPSYRLKNLEKVHLIEKPVQETEMEIFTNLKPKDLLFIDSTHTVKPGSDVNFLFLEVLPRLSKGVLVHIHDIFLPYDYPRNVLESPFQWMETSLLHAFLINNPKARVIFCLSHLHYEDPEGLKHIFSGYRPAPDLDGLEISGAAGRESSHFPASIFIEII